MKMKKTLSLLASAALLSPVLGTTLAGEQVSAEESNSEISVDEDDTQELSEDLIEKADPFVSIVDNEYVLSEDARTELTEDEYESVASAIAQTNEALSTTETQNDLVQTDEDTLTVVGTPSNDNTMMDSSVTTNSVAGNVNVEYTWWGAQVQFSHAAVNEFASFAGAVDTGAGIGADAFSDFLGLYGIQVPSVYFTSIAALGSLTATAMQSVDNGNGVNLNMILYVPATFTAR